MLTLKGGPCEGTYYCKHAPVILRATVDEDGTIDVLDAPDDVPKPTETIYLYQRTTDVTQVHLSGKKIHGFFAWAEYKYISPGGGVGKSTLVIVCAGGCGKTTEDVNQDDFWEGKIEPSADPDEMVPIWTCKECKNKPREEQL